MGCSEIDGEISITNGDVSIAGCEYQNCSEIVIDENADEIILGESDSLPNVSNRNGASVTYNDKEYIMPDVEVLNEEPHRTTKPAKADIFVKRIANTINKNFFIHISFLPLLNQNMEFFALFLKYSYKNIQI